ncbi:MULTISPECIES: FliH/SctL family protein [unclassified Thioalkalivibrio]|uniref:FliH/SctL family protein n=1 Tax=unclassified Thioalkalivibrio TaxID=2621013 RepID=UPI0003683C77|nr:MULTISPECIES: FliH/SctL family protein [unclassified Thioalkalivibrio]
MTSGSGAQTRVHDPDASVWEPPEIGEGGVRPARRLPTAAEIEAIEDQARQNGFEAGYAEGHALGKQEAEKAARAKADKQLRETVAKLESLGRGLIDPLAEAADQLEPELLELTVAIARKVLAAELKTRPELIEQVLHRALAQLPGRHQEVRVHVHPADRALLEDYAQGLDAGVHWVSDTKLARGGCRVEAGAALVDASLEHRLQQAVEAIWGELEASASASQQPEDGSAPGDGT